MFKNSIGRILYDCNISGKFSKVRKIDEKAYKNQLKVAVVRMNEEKKPQVHYCLVNFSRNEEMV